MTSPSLNKELVAKEREAFEAQYKHLTLNYNRDAWGGPRYICQPVQDLWEGWLARAASTPSALPVEGAGPMTEERLTVGFMQCRAKSDNYGDWFDAGARYAEKHHAIVGTPSKEGGGLSEEKIAALANIAFQEHFEDKNDNYELALVRAVEREHGIVGTPDNPHEREDFRQLCREHEVLGTAMEALCGVFWTRGFLSKEGAAQVEAVTDEQIKRLAYQHLQLWDADTIRFARAVLSLSPSRGEALDAARFGYALAMRVLQSDLYRTLDEVERAECDEFIRRVQSQGSAQP